MPELPEVETVRRALRREVVGLEVGCVLGESIMMRRPLDIEGLASVVPTRQIVGVRRRGKYLLLDFDPPGSLLCHLGMSGRMVVANCDREMDPHTHLVLDLEHRRQIRLVDPRRFGFAAWLEPGDEESDPSLCTLGIEPLDPGLSEALPRLFKSRSAPVKTLLLDQHLVAGVGNIYAVETLWRAAIRPTRRGRATSTARLRRLAGALRSVIEEAIDQGGTTIRDFASPDGDFGYFAVRLDAYGRQGRPCRRCGKTLRADVIAGRTTAWCRGCQR